MLLNQGTKIYFSELGNNNFLYPNKENYFILEENIEVQFLELLNSEKFKAFKMLHENKIKVFWILL